MNYEIVAVGKIKEKFLRDGILEYTKRLGAFSKLEIREVKDSEDVSREGFEILSKIDDNSYVILLDISGDFLDSTEFAKFLGNLKLRGISKIVFVIGGSQGVSEEVRARADYRLSFSKMTFPHQLMRLIFLEQLYRAETIQNGLPYHK